MTFALSDFVTNHLDTIILYAPIGVIGLWRWSVWIVKKTFAVRYRPIAPNGYRARLSIVTPVYNENPEVFRQALESWKQNRPDEIIAVIDYQDQICVGEFKEFSKTFPHAILIVTKAPGKREALRDGVNVATGEIVALVDSDTIWDRAIRARLLAPFADQEVGGVGTRQDVLETDTLPRRLFSIHLDQRYFDELPFLAHVGNALTCLSGRTALYRKAAILGIMDDVVNETFLGRKCVSGEDKCLTRLVQAHGWKTRYQQNALVWTVGAPDFIAFFKQQTRWIRNSWRSDLKSLSSRWVWREKFLALHMLDRFIQPFTLLVGPIYLFISLLLGHWAVAGIFLLWLHVSRAVKIFPHLKRKPSDLPILPIYILSTYVLGIIRIYALFTVAKQGWLTRWDKERLGKQKTLDVIPSYVGTAGVIVLLIAGVAHFKGILEGNFSGYVGGTPSIEGYKEHALQSAAPQYAHYAVRKGDALEKISRRYNAGLAAIMNANRESIGDPEALAVGQQIKIPVDELRHGLEKDRVISFGDPGVIYHKSENTIVVLGQGGMVTIPQIYRIVGDERALAKVGDREWILRANLEIQKGVTLVIDGSEVSWLKLKSGEDGFVWLKGTDANILISGTKITSWDESKDGYDTDSQDGRSFILARSNGRMDILNSELAFLGYRSGPESEEPVVPSYGVSWKIPHDGFGRYLITGTVYGSKFHHNYFGLYTYGAMGITIRENEFSHNALYGIDLHDNSNHFSIEKNRVYANGRHGIMLYEDSNANRVQDNVVYDNADGIAVHGSYKNYIGGNTISGNSGSGIRLNANASENYLENNQIKDNENGIYVYGNANHNLAIGNDLEQNTRGVYLKDVIGTIVQNTLNE